jgi:hypothetical protein
MSNMPKSLPPEILEYHNRRRKTRFIRVYGGLIAMFVSIGMAIWIVAPLVKREMKSSQVPPLETKKEEQHSQSTDTKPSVAAVVTPKKVVETPKASQETPPSIETKQAMGRWNEAAKALEGFFSAASVEERMAWVVPSSELEAKLLEYEKRAVGLPWLGKPEKVGPQFALQGNYLITTVTFPGQKPRNIALEKTSLGFRVDWESYVGYCERPLKDIASDEKSDDAFEVRTEAYRVSPPPPGYPANEYLALLLRHPDDGTALQAVVSRKMLGESPAGKALSDTLPGRYTLRVKPSANAAETNSWAVVSEVVCPGWLPRLYAAGAP